MLIEYLYLTQPTQYRIAAVLSAYDDLIENNTQRIAALEAAAQALYREWFVEMRFPGHESADWWDSELGRIPVGWEWVAFPDAIEINPRHRIPKDTEKIYVPMDALSTDSMLITSFEYRQGNSGAKFMNDDTLMARITPSLENGKTAYVQFLPTDETVAIGSTEFIVLRSKTLCSELVYLLTRSPEIREPAIKSMTGASGRQRVQIACFDEIFIPQPDQAVLKPFQEQVAPVFELIQSLAERNTVLREARDLLLPASHLW
jgi:type I restriction enzyme S subunit